MRATTTYSYSARNSAALARPLVGWVPAPRWTDAEASAYVLAVARNNLTAAERNFRDACDLLGQANTERKRLRRQAQAGAMANLNRARASLRRARAALLALAAAPAGLAA